MILFRKIIKKKKLIQRVLLCLMISAMIGGTVFYLGKFPDLPAQAGNTLVEKAQASASSAVASAQLEEIIQSKLSSSIPLKSEIFTIDAEAGISASIQNGQATELFAKSKINKLPIASLTKLMTALIVLERYDLGHKVTISKAVMTQVGEQGSLQEGEVLTVKNLLYITLIESSNRAAYALSEVMGTEQFIAAMNAKAQDMGMVDTYFQDVTGLDAKSYSTVNDLLVLSKHVYEQYPLFREITGFKEFKLYVAGKPHHTLLSTNNLLGQESVVSGKTGWTEEARGCFMVIQKGKQEGDYFIHIVLGAKDRFLEMKKLMSFSR